MYIVLNVYVFIAQKYDKDINTRLSNVKVTIKFKKSLSLAYQLMTLSDRFVFTKCCSFVPN